MTNSTVIKRPPKTGVPKGVEQLKPEEPAKYSVIAHYERYFCSSELKGVLTNVFGYSYPAFTAAERTFKQTKRWVCVNSLSKDVADTKAAQANKSVSGQYSCFCGSKIKFTVEKDSP